ncbi:MAG: STAS domain-containing protein [Actinomycetota bacterium]|nr:STAS domain-containing protein [Actinomycetota bacterium]
MAWLSLVGQLDLRSAGVLARELLGVEGRVRRVVLDARRLSFLDAVGVQVLLHASQRAKRGGWEFAVIRGSKPLERLVRFPNIARRLRLVSDPAELLS